MDDSEEKRQEKTRKLFPVAGLKDFSGSLCTKKWCKAGVKLQPQHTVMYNHNTMFSFFYF